MVTAKRVYVPLPNGKIISYKIGGNGIKNFLTDEEDTPISTKESNIISIILILLNTEGTPVGFKLMNNKEEEISIICSQNLIIEYI